MNPTKSRWSVARRTLVALGAASLISTAFSTAAVAGGNLAKAREEGKVVWYSSIALPIAQELCNAFNAKSMGFECVLHRSGSGKLFKRWLQEAKSGIFEADILHTSNIGHFVQLAKEAHIIQYRPEGADSFNPAFLDKDGYWSVLRAFAYVPIYNTDKVKGDDIPKSWMDVLDPKWKGKSVSAHPSYSGSVSIGIATLVKEFGWDFLDKLAAQDPRVVQSAVDTVAYVARGEALISSGTGTYNAFNGRRRGEPVSFAVPKEGAPFIRSPQGIFAKAPHPNAAKIFSDWLFSLEAQQILGDRGLYVGHPGVKYPADLVPLNSLNLMVLPPDEAAKMRKPVRDAFTDKLGV